MGYPNQTIFGVAVLILLFVCCLFDIIERKKKLQLIVEHQLYGRLQSIQSVRLPHDSLDSLLLAFSDAKVICLGYQFAYIDFQLKC